jgi:hypothetical protein
MFESLQWFAPSAPSLLRDVESLGRTAAKTKFYPPNRWTLAEKREK